MLMFSACLGCALLSALPSTVPATQHTEKLSVALDPSVSVLGFTLSPDGTRVGLTEQPVGPTGRIWSVPVAAPANAAELSDLGWWLEGVAFSPDSSRLYFTGLDTGLDLFSAPADASAPATFVADGPTNLSYPGTLLRIQPSSDGLRVVYTYSTGYPGFQSQVAVVPADGNGPTVLGGGSYQSSLRAAFDGDEEHVIVQRGSLDNEELFWLTCDGTEPVRALTPSILDVNSFELLEATPFSQPILAVAGALDGAGPKRLARIDVPHKGTAGRASRDTGLQPRPLTPSGANITGFRLTPDRRQAVAVDAAGTLWRVPVDGSTAAVALAGPTVVGANVYLPTSEFLQVTPDGNHVVFLGLSSQYEVFSVPLAGGPVARASMTFPAGTGVIPSSVRLTPDGAHVLFIASRGSTDLWSASAAGGSFATNLSSMPSGGVVRGPVRVLSDSSAVVYLGAVTPNVDELWLAPLGGNHPPKRVSTSLQQPGSDVSSDFQVDPAGEWVYYRADAETDEHWELYRTGLGSHPRAAVR